MMNSWLAFVESNTSGTGRLFARVASQKGFRPILLSDDPARYSYVSQDGLDTLEVDTRTEGTLLDACRRLAPGAGLAGVTSSSEYFVSTAASIARRLGLAGPSPVAVRVCRDKFRQRRQLQKAGVPMPAFRRATSIKTAIRAAQELGLPVIVKPVSGSGSVGVKLCLSLDEVGAHAAQLLNQRHNERGAPVARRILIESVASGPEYSVETFGLQVIGITQKHLGPLPDFVEIGHDYPAQLLPTTKKAIESIAQQSLVALGLGWGPAHVELRVSESGPQIIEVNPRLAGGYIPELVRLSCGIDLISETIMLVVGEQPELRSSCHDHASIRFILAPEDGTLVEVKGLDQAQSVPGIMEVKLYLPPGTEMRRHRDFRDRVGHVIARGSTHEEAVQAAEAAHRAVNLIIQPQEIFVAQGAYGSATLPEPTGNNQLENTGRILHGVSASARRILFGQTSRESVAAELGYIAQVDRAHVIMLSECKIINEGVACRLLSEIGDLEASGFAPLADVHAPRGLYLAYEDFLRRRLGEEIGGVLHTARSRNDLNATTLRLRLRAPYLRLLREALRLQVVLIRRAGRYGDIVMPAYTHYQAAVPISYGHYLAGVASVLERDINGVMAAFAGLNDCPLGAGSVGGTSLPIDPQRTTMLLGFERAVSHSVDAVASRDLVLRILAAASVLGVTLSRLASDLLLWTTAEFGFLSLPDQLIGSSSMMPQKRNPFLLEHVQGRSAMALGAFVSSAMAMHAKPFTNSISVGTEAVSPVWNALQSLSEALILARLVVAGAEPQPAAMLQRATDGYTAATEFANRLVTETGMPFRSAHHLVGSLINDAIEHKEPLQHRVSRWREEQNISISLEGLDPEAVVKATIYGGGPGPASLASCLEKLRAEWRNSMSQKRAQVQKWDDAAKALNETAVKLCTQSLRD
jgi:argininosuccinate lyase